MSKWPVRLAIFSLALVLGLAAAFFAGGIYLGPCGFAYLLPWAASNVEVQNDPAADDRAIYGSIYNELEAGRGPHLIDESTLKVEIDEFEDPQLLPGVSPEALADFYAKNTDSVPLAPLISGLSTPGIITKADSESVFARRGDRRNSWDLFHDQYPGIRGTISFSRIGYNIDHTQAIVYYGEYCGGLCGVGSFLLYKKTGGTWKKVGTGPQWVS